MSRESRVSMNVRQNDALFEFESFKKKFLLANKHITKLNSTLSVRIEELNAQISSLYVENLRLRATEIALTAQLKREREKSNKIIADAEAATANLTKHLLFLRQQFDIHPPALQPPHAKSPLKPRPRPRESNPDSPPQGNRISRAPNIPGINEESEPPSDVEDLPPPPQQSPKRKPKSTKVHKSRLAASKLPLPPRSASPPPPSAQPATPYVDLAGVRKKPVRRQSGLLNVRSSNPEHRDGPLSVPRAASPAFGSPIRREAALEEEDDACANEVDVEAEMAYEPLKKKEKKSRARQEPDRDVDRDAHRDGREREPREQRKSKLKDVTNTNSGREPENTTNPPPTGHRRPPSTSPDPDPRSSDSTPGPLPTTASSAPGPSSSTTRMFLAPPSLSAVPSTSSSSSSSSSYPVSDRKPRDKSSKEAKDKDKETDKDKDKEKDTRKDRDKDRERDAYLPTPRPSSSPPPASEQDKEPDAAHTHAQAVAPGQPEPEGDPGVGLIAGRERRARKSVNYAEPKLNTKMRKPDPPGGGVVGTTGTGAGKKRVSASAMLGVVDDGYRDKDKERDREPTPRSSLEQPTPRSSLELPLGPSGHATIGVDFVEERRRRKVVTAYQYHYVDGDGEEGEGEGEGSGAEADAEWWPGGVSVRGGRKVSAGRRYTMN